MFSQEIHKVREINTNLNREYYIKVVPMFGYDNWFEISLLDDNHQIYEWMRLILSRSEQRSFLEWYINSRKEVLNAKVVFGNKGYKKETYIGFYPNYNYLKDLKA